jgi:glycerophosphoryl diester phosphodiesterase
LWTSKMWNDLAPIVVIAHRGDKAFAPENTVSAFRQAADKGAPAVEFDVKLSADGHVVVIHDQTVDRTTNGHGDVRHLSLAALRELDAGVQFPGQFPGEKIPTLDEVFESLGKRLYMNVELTNYATPNDGLVEKVADLVRKHAMQERVIFSSFLPGNLQKARRLLPEVPRGLLTLPGLPGWWGRSFGWRADCYAALHPYMTGTNIGLVNRVHAAGKRLNVWTVTAEADIKRMIGLGVDGIITDDPALVLRKLGRGG